jgi:hypothetical protein
MSGNNPKIIDANEFIETMENILSRPEMYAQNAASLEDQMHLLYMFLTTITDADGRTHNSYRRFQSFCTTKTKTNHPLAVHYKEIQTILPVLKEFFEPELQKIKSK